MKTEKRKKEAQQRRPFAKKVYWDLLYACSDNVDDLIKSAEILLKNNMYSKSFLMSYLALEELGKRLAVCDYITDILSDEEFKKIFRDHDLKMAYLHNMCQLTKPTDDKSFGYEATIVYDVKKYHDFFIEKQKATYVDFDIQNEIILNPLKNVSKEDAEQIFNYITKKVQDTYYFEYVSERIGTKAFLK